MGFIFGWPTTHKSKLEPVFDCTFPGFPGSEESFIFNPPSWWQEGNLSYDEWNEVIASHDFTGMTSEAIDALLWEISYSLWEGWLQRGHLSIFEHDGESLPNWTVPISEVLALLEYICDDCYQPDVTVTLEDALN